MTDSIATSPRASLARMATLFAAVAIAGATLAGCGGGGGSSPSPSPTPTPSPSPTPTPSPSPTPTPSPSPTPASPLANEQLTGAIDYIHDPAVARQGSKYYVFSTDKDATSGGFIPIRCTTDKVAVTDCGFVFTTLPSWIATAVPAATQVWAPDISYFNGKYHLYYSVSSFGVNKSAIGLATNTTLDRSDPAYAWVDEGPVLQSATTSNYNAIDPNIAIDGANVWLSYGSFWSGIFQQQVDPATGQLATGATAASLATRPGVTYNPIEGANLVKHNGYWYLFTSWDFCCQSPASASNYKIVVGRGTSPNGPFVDQGGVALTAGGGTILLQGNSSYGAPGGASVLVDSDASYGDVIVFHALDLARNGVPVLFMKSLTWTNDWPVIGS